MSSSLDPLDFQEDIDQYDAHVETKRVTFPECNHKSVEFKNGELLCKCGAGWSGAGINELYKLLKKQ